MTGPPELTATYRLQLRPGFGFAEATRTLRYLAELGVSHVYLSPCFEAEAGSPHGYDIVDFSQVRAELGGMAGFEDLSAEATRLGVGLVLDIVPHHMSTASDRNPWWWDVLELGRASRYAQHFDIDWDPPEAKLRDIVLLPVLADHYGRVLESGELRVEWTPTGRFQVRYHDVVAPLSPVSVGTLAERAAQRAGSDEVAFVGRTLQQLDAADDVRTAVRELARLAARDPAVASAFESTLDELNADSERLDALLSEQHYRLARWQVAFHELDYRRFFDITSLAALRSERAEVFRDTHGLVLALVARGAVAGLRIDHIDGLADPLGYLERLRAAAGPDVWLIVEKILRPGERLPAAWPIDGTTGYDFLQRAGGLFVDAAGAAELELAYRRVTGDGESFARTAIAARREVLQQTFAADVERLTALLVCVCERNRRYRDFTRAELRDAVVELLAHAPAYRSYVRLTADRLVAADADVAFVDTTIAAARDDRPDLDPDLLDLLRGLLCGEVGGQVEAAFALRFQQLSGPVAAKGEEDTAFYRSVWLLPLDEVGSEPSDAGMEPDRFHRENLAAQREWPRTMVTTSTHDTKRSEDVRARLALLSEIPAEWEEAVTLWVAINERHRTNGWPDRRTEWVLYQTLVGAHPLPADRAWTCMEKSVREANVHTSWVRPNAAYEAAVRAFVERALGDPEFLRALDAFSSRLVEPGRVSSLAQVVLRLLAPGIPDTYQGCELWDDSLVDPDNRRPVNFDLRRRYLHELVPESGPAAWAARQDTGLPKLFTLRACLALRRRYPPAFGPAGAYDPLVVAGPDEAHAVGFVRGGTVAGIVPRLVMRLNGRPIDATVSLPAGSWHNVCTGDDVEGGGEVGVADLFARFPVAVLARASAAVAADDG